MSLKLCPTCQGHKLIRAQRQSDGKIGYIFCQPLMKSDGAFHAGLSETCNGDGFIAVEDKEASDDLD